MAYMSQDRKAQIAPVVKAILKKYNLKGSLSVRNHSTLCLTLKSGAVDFIGNFNELGAKAFREDWMGPFVPAKYIDVNPYHFQRHFSGKALKVMTEIYNAMMAGNHDNSDIQTDYFDVGWYIDINVGTWNKPYEKA